jgi:hypothetical protein
LVVTDDSIVASARLGQSLGYKKKRKKKTIALQNKYFILTGKRAVSGGVSVERLLEFVDEDCCQAEQLVEFDVAVSFGITPRVFFLF